MRRLVFILFASPALYLFGCVNAMTSPSDSTPGNRDHAMEIVAHRGASAVAPENTVSAYRLAWTMNADAAETDIYLTRDNQIVAIHDETTSRTAGGVDLPIKDSTLAQLRALDVGKWKDARYTSERIPLLSEILATIPPGKRLYIEIKCGPEVLPYLEKVIDESGKRNQVAIIGFELDTVAQSKKQMPDIPTYWLRGTYEDEVTNEDLPHDIGWVDQVRLHKLDGLDVDHAGVTPEFVRALREANLGFLVWTVDDPEIAKRMKQLGADGLTTDKPDLMLEFR